MLFVLIYTKYYISMIQTIAITQQAVPKLQEFEERILRIQQKHFYWFTRQPCPKRGTCPSSLSDHIALIPDFGNGLEVLIDENIPPEIRWECQSAFYDIFKPLKS